MQVRGHGAPWCASRAGTQLVFRRFLQEWACELTPAASARACRLDYSLEGQDRVIDAARAARATAKTHELSSDNLRELGYPVNHFTFDQYAARAGCQSG